MRNIRTFLDLIFSDGQQKNIRPLSNIGLPAIQSKDAEFSYSQIPFSASIPSGFEISPLTFECSESESSKVPIGTLLIVKISRLWLDEEEKQRKTIIRMNGCFKVEANELSQENLLTFKFELKFFSLFEKRVDGNLIEKIDSKTPIFVMNGKRLIEGVL